jgi:ABC-type transport system involved in cytochrome c biogenesis permease subunit
MVKRVVLDNKKRSTILAGILILLGVLVVLTPWYIFPVCEIAEKSGTTQMETGSDNAMSMNINPGSHMKCWYTAEAETGVGVLLILTGVALLALPGRVSRKTAGILGGILGLIVILVPTILVGVCTTPDAPCRIGTLPALILLGAVTVITGIYLVLSKDAVPAGPN